MPGEQMPERPSDDARQQYVMPDPNRLRSQRQQRQLEQAQAALNNLRKHTPPAPETKSPAPAWEIDPSQPVLEARPSEPTQETDADHQATT